MREERYWVVTASADHAENGRNWGIVQACHGKSAPLRRMQPGDGVAIYSPRDQFHGGEPLQAFTAIGRVTEGDAYQHDMGGGFIAWRRGVLWQQTQPAPIRPLLDHLDLTRGQRNWGMAFRYGLLPISQPDFALIARVMLGLAERHGTPDLCEVPPVAG